MQKGMPEVFEREEGKKEEISKRKKGENKSQKERIRCTDRYEKAKKRKVQDSGKAYTMRDGERMKKDDKMY